MKHLHWYAHRKGCCTNGAGRNVQGDIGTHTHRGVVQMEQAEVYRVTLVRTQRGVLYKWSRQKCTGYIGTHTQRDVVQVEQAEVYRLHWFAHTEECGTNGASRSVQGCIGTHTQRDAVQMEQAEVYRVTLVRTHRGTLYTWSRQKCTGLHWYAHRGVLYKWSKQK